MSDEHRVDILANRPESEDQFIRDQREWFALIPIGTLAVLGTVLYVLYMKLWSSEWQEPGELDWRNA
jgi:hypothetical protein